MKNSIEQLAIPSLLVNHFYVGVIITLFYIGFSPMIIHAGFPGISVLLAAEIFILAPLVFAHLKISARKQSVPIQDLILFRQRLSPKSFIAWSLFGLLACAVVYLPLYPVGLFLRENWFGWLPEWYFNPLYGTENIQLIANTFLIGIVVDGLIGPIAEELFFRGYLLPRMAFLKNWAPLVNGSLFGLYHFWQPHNFLATMAVGIVLSFVAWKTKNVYVAIVIHCTLNILGAVGGFMAASGGIVISR
ncbi:CPBP family intramembrane glutamic endopeptidase [Algoriphagus sp. SE2]|uniref:CPBP family intramembrane glutamic endopeptidase n=1 Tax=Algoriphagus sp. SE2 TaxID=3141536 RepID=UPI0031CD3E68